MDPQMTGESTATKIAHAPASNSQKKQRDRPALYDTTLFAPTAELRIATVCHRQFLPTLHPRTLHHTTLVMLRVYLALSCFQAGQPSHTAIPAFLPRQILTGRVYLIAVIGYSCSRDREAMRVALI